MWEKKIYHCSRTNAINAEVATFGVPVLRCINYQPVSGYVNVLQYGEMVSRIYSAIVNFDKYVGVFKEGDLVYLCGKNNKDGATPDITEAGYVNGKGANAMVKSVRNQNIRIEIIFEKLV